MGSSRVGPSAASSRSTVSQRKSSDRCWFSPLTSGFLTSYGNKPVVLSLPLVIGILSANKIEACSPGAVVLALGRGQRPVDIMNK